MVYGQKVKKIKLKQKKSKRGAARNNAVRSNADRVLAQGTGRSVQKAFGASSVPRPLNLPNGCWDAFNSTHAALPRAVGPYTVVRTSALLTSNAKFIMVGTTRTIGTMSSGISGLVGTQYWSNVAMAESNDQTTANDPVINSTNATKFQPIAAPGGNVESRADSTFTCCPAAVSCQVMGKTNLQQADGQLAAAVIPARMDLRGDSRTWEDVGKQVVSYFRPRLMSAGKLSLRGVQMDSHPLSMADVSEFLPMEPVATEYTPSDGWKDANSPQFCGWAPMAIYNPDKADLSILVSIEWRVRFDINNPAVSSHSHHGVTTDHAWEQHLKRAHSALPGVLDIVEKVANTGAAVYKLGRLASVF